MHNGEGCFGSSRLWSAVGNGEKGGQICQGCRLGILLLKLTCVLRYFSSTMCKKRSHACKLCVKDLSVSMLPTLPILSHEMSLDHTDILTVT